MRRGGRPLRSFTFDLRCPECDTVVAEELDFEPDDPPVPCSNPDSPAYSDPGSAGAVGDFPSRCLACGTAITSQYAYEKGYDEFRDQQQAAYEDYCDRKYDEFRDRDL
jgi:hypothetical protein